MRAAWRPFTQTAITSPTIAATSSGTQPPSLTRRMLAPKKNRSSARKGATSIAVHTGSHCQYFHAMMKARQVVTTIVPVTAMP